MMGFYWLSPFAFAFFFLFKRGLISFRFHNTAVMISHLITYDHYTFC